MKKVKVLDFNWRQVGSVQDRDGAGEDYNRLAVGVNKVVSIEESKSYNGTNTFSYLATFECGKQARIFNPNYVEYFE